MMNSFDVFVIKDFTVFSPRKYISQNFFFGLNRWSEIFLPNAIKANLSNNNFEIGKSS